MTVKFSFILKNGRDVVVTTEDKEENINEVLNVISTAFLNNLESVAKIDSTLVRISDCSVAEWEIINE